VSPSVGVDVGFEGCVAEVCSVQRRITNFMFRAAHCVCMSTPGPVAITVRPKAKAYNACIAAYRSRSGAVHVTNRTGVQPIGSRLSLRPQTDLRPASHTQAWSAV